MCFGPIMKFLSVFAGFDNIEYSQGYAAAASSNINNKNKLKKLFFKIMLKMQQQPAAT